MPATDQYWRSLPQTHRVFAWSAVALLGATLLMIWKDESREYLAYQREAEALRIAKLETDLEGVETSSYEAEIADLRAKQSEAEKGLQGHRDQIVVLEAELKQLKGQSEVLARDTKSFNAQRDKARADYDIAIRDNVSGQALAAVIGKFDDLVDRARASGLELERKQQEIQAVRGQIDQLKSAVTEVQAALSKAEFRENQLREQLDKLAPENWFSAAKRAFKQLPIVNGFDPIHKIQYDWPVGLDEQLGMAKVARLDRCRSCHVNISEFGAGNVPMYPQGEFAEPFCSHPRPELYLTATSPHSRDKFGCTICHAGDGSGTSFQHSEHTPNDPASAHEWEGQFAWHSNHFWEYPMSPRRFVESGCIRCHHSVTELGVNAEYGASAPKVYEGFRLISQYGCFGCHEINGYDGTTPIGPDLRLEPQTEEEAAKLAADPNVVPGTMRKVGPSLRHVASKSTAEFVAFWTADPSRFRPTTRMPRPFGLTNQHDGLAELLQPIELAGVAAYLEAKSQPLELLTPREGYTPDIERGKLAFERRGCMACHSHAGEEFAGLKQDFGPELSKVHEKIKPGVEGFHWLYTWIKEPTRHHSRTKMPDLFLDATGEGDEYVDPAADIAAFLLAGGPAEFPALAKPASYIGVVADEHFDLARAKSLGLDESSFSGVLIKEVLQGSPAARAMPEPLRPQDVITKFNDTSLKSATQLADLEAATAVGTEVTLTVLRKGRSTTVTVKVSNPLDDLAYHYLRKSNSQSRLDQIIAEKRYLVPDEAYTGDGGLKSFVKGDEIELVALEPGEDVSDEDWTARKLQYVGRRTIARYGCYGCHDIPGFESSRPIGAGLADWGRKATSKLAFEHITEYLHHHGEPDGSSTAERVEEAVELKLAGVDVPEADLSAAFFYESIEHHGRPGFIWQKLREPRSYDYHKIETKAYDERLLMPKFNFTEEQIEAIATFVLGLVADPPAPEFQYRPEGPEKDIVEGERLLTKYNCTGCHMLTVPSVDLALDPDSLDSWEIKELDQPAVDRLWKMRPIRDARTGKTTGDGRPVFNILAHIQAEDRDFGEYSYLLWDTHRFNDETIIGPGQTMAVEGSQIVASYPPRGGEFTSWLIPRLHGNAPGVKDLNTAWQATAPNLYKEGHKVQTPWLFQFLKNPEQLRYTTVLRMPRFNMDDNEAQQLANYFAAVDAVEYPYQKIGPQDSEVQHLKSLVYNAKYPDAGMNYLTASWRALNLDQKCVTCHAVGGNVVTGTDPTKVTRAPNLNRIEARLRPDWVDLWIYEPHWLTPYTVMPVNFASDQSSTKTLFDGNNVRLSQAVVDALFNYTRLMEAHGPTLYRPTDAAPPEEQAAADAATDNGAN